MKIVNVYNLLTIFAKKLHCRCLIASYIRILYLKFKYVPVDKLVPKASAKDSLWQSHIPPKYSSFYSNASSGRIEIAIKY